MDYKETLEMVKKQNPDKDHRWCQKQASTIFNTYKEGQKNLKENLGAAAVKAADPALKPGKFVYHGTIPVAELNDAEKRLKGKPLDINAIIVAGREHIYEGFIVNHGKAANGVNSLVTFEDNDGNRFPVEGYFEVWI
jgi:ribosomal protein S4E